MFPTASVLVASTTAHAGRSTTSPRMASRPCGPKLRVMHVAAPQAPPAPPNPPNPPNLTSSEWYCQSVILRSVASIRGVQRPLCWDGVFPFSFAVEHVQYRVKHINHLGKQSSYPLLEKHLQIPPVHTCTLPPPASLSKKAPKRPHLYT